MGIKRSPRVKSYQVLGLAKMYKHYVNAPKCDFIRTIPIFLSFRIRNVCLNNSFCPVIAKETHTFFEILSSYNGVYGDSSLMGCYVVSTDKFYRCFESTEPVEHPRKLVSTKFSITF